MNGESFEVIRMNKTIRILMNIFEVFIVVFKMPLTIVWRSIVGLTVLAFIGQSGSIPTIFMVIVFTYIAFPVFEKTILHL